MICVGAHITKLRDYTTKLEAFPQSHPLLRHPSDPELFRKQMLTWHQDFLQFQKSIHKDFDVVWSETTSSSNIILALYIVSKNIISDTTTKGRRLKFNYVAKNSKVISLIFRGGVF